MKTKKISWQAIAIVVLALVLIASIALGVSGAWFQDADSVSQTSTMGTPVRIWLQKDGSEGANVETWNNLYKTGETEVYPGDVVMGATEIATGTTTPSVIRMTLKTSVKTSEDDEVEAGKVNGKAYDAITAMTAEEAAAFDQVAERPKRNAYKTEPEYTAAMGTYTTKVNKYNKYLLETMLDKTMANMTTWTASGDYYYYNEIVKAVKTIDVFAQLKLDTGLTNECSGWIISVSVDVEAIQAANLSENADWYAATETAGKIPTTLKDKVDDYNTKRAAA